MAIVLTHISTTSAKTSSSSLTVTVGAGGVPTGSCIFVVGGLNASGPTVGNASDSQGNTYQNPASLRNANTNNIAVGIGYAYNTTTALVSGDTISIAFSAAVNASSASVFYATGLDTGSDPLDAATDNTATNVNTTSVTMAAAPAVAGSLIVAASASRGLLSAFVQDSTNAAYATPPNGVGTTGNPTSSNCAVAGGTVVSSSQLTYAPTTATGVAYVIAAFAPSAGAPAVRHDLPVLGVGGFVAIEGLQRILRNARQTRREFLTPWNPMEPQIKRLLNGKRE